MNSQASSSAARHSSESGSNNAEQQTTTRDNDWHSLSVEQTCSKLGATKEKGLDSDTVTQRQQKYGPNRITEKQAESGFIRFMRQFHQPLVYILLAATAVTLFLQEWVDAGVIFGVVLINSMIGYIQETKALNAINSLSKALPSHATVIRNGRRQSINASELVPGDVVVLAAGDKISADLRLLATKDLQINESALTGESVPVEKNTIDVEADTSLGDRRNMAFSSTFVTYGGGVGIVTDIGDHTEIGKISQLIATTQTLDTPLTKRIKQFSHWLLYAILVLAAITLVAGFLHGQSGVDAFMAAVALAVGAIPEGLPAAVTIMLAIGVSRMAKRRAIIRNLTAVETLGSTTVVCSDKTGTLTKNEMTVKEIWTFADGSDGDAIQVSGEGYDSRGEVHYGEKDEAIEANSALYQTLLTGLQCNDSSLAKGKTGFTEIIGDPTEAALLVSAQKAGLGQEPHSTRLDDIPFQSEYQYMATLHPSHHDVSEQNAKPDNVAFVKGSVESLLARCNAVLTDNGTKSVDDGQKAIIIAHVENMASRGLRVLAFAQKMIPHHHQSLSHQDLDDDLVFVGLQGMIDPPRPEAKEAVATCHRAGIEVKMITGDHALTAGAIAEQLGILSPNDTEHVITGAELSKLTQEDFTEAAQTYRVFARVSPNDKLDLVKALQKREAVVAMTGDGVNDAPALRRADIGVAMAAQGTEVAREASDMMLTDDNFATVQAAIEEGRGVFDNLKKFIVWTLPTNGGEALVILAAVMLGLSLPLLPIHILWVNMTTAICLGLMLAFEPKEQGIMSRPPNVPNAPLLDAALIWRIVMVSSLLSIAAFGLYELELMWGATQAEARTVAVAMFVVGEAFYLFNCRSLKHSWWSVGMTSNPWLWFGLAVMAILQLAFTYMPIMNDAFQTAPISFDAWVRVMICGLAISLLVGLEKWLRFNRKKKVYRPGNNATGAMS